jgi:hypothetical protein
MVIDMTKMLFGVRSAKLPVTTGLNGALSNSKLFYNTVALRQHQIEYRTGLTMLKCVFRMSSMCVEDAIVFFLVKE